MNETVNTFLLMGDKFMLEMHLKQPGFTYSACGPFIKNKERIKKLCRQEIQTFFREMYLTRLVFKMILLLVNQKIYQKELNQTKFWEIKHLKLRVIQNMVVIKEGSFNGLKFFW